VPVDVLSGVPGPNPDRICRLCGSTRPLDPARLAARYPSREAYEEQYRDAVDEVVEAGFVLHADRDALLAFAQPERVAW
jgi:hypothetical protein